MNSPLPQPALSLPQVAARSLLLPAVGVVLAFVVHRFVMPHVDEYFAGIALDVGVNIMLAVSLTIVNGFTGQFSIGHAGFMALGAYTAGTITYYGSILLWQSPQFAGGALSLSSERMIADGLFARGDLLFLAGCVAGALIAGIAGLVVGLPSLRLRGDYLAIVTLGFGEIVRILLEQSREQLVLERLPENPTPQQLEQYQTMLAKIQDIGFPELLLHAGSAKGFGDVPNYASAFWVVVFATFTLAVAFRLKNSSHGRALLAIRENEVAASAMGVPVTRYKVIAFVISFVICFAFNLSGFPMVIDMFSAWAPQAVVDVISSFSFLTHFNAIVKGVIDVRDLVFFASLIAFWLYANVLAIEMNKSN